MLSTVKYKISSFIYLILKIITISDCWLSTVIYQLSITHWLFLHDFKKCSCYSKLNFCYKLRSFCRVYNNSLLKFNKFFKALPIVMRLVIENCFSVIGVCSHLFFIYLLWTSSEGGCDKIDYTGSHSSKSWSSESDPRGILLWEFWLQVGDLTRLQHKLILILWTDYSTYISTRAREGDVKWVEPWWKNCLCGFCIV